MQYAIIPAMKDDIRMLRKEEIIVTKEHFNTFFRDELYGKLKNDDNIILSRGAWSDTCVQLPTFFTFCLSYTLTKNWVGYSDSLGHENTLHALRELLNINKKSHRYTGKNLALTIGNSFTLGMVFKQLRATYGDQPLLTLIPFYPSIVKSISHHFKKIYITSSLQSEEALLVSIEKAIKTNLIKILFLSNFIGVEGRTFSKKFWKRIIRLVQKHDVFLVIDEGEAFAPLPYPDEINNPNIVRVVSVSKRLGTPGMKLGYLVGGSKFIADFYETASTNYGGPLSVFFLLAEFLYSFEHVRLNPTKTNVLKRLSEQYEISFSKIISLCKNYCHTHKQNEKQFTENYTLLKSWLHTNNSIFEEIHLFNGINVLVKPKGLKGKCHAFFLHALTTRGVSVIPSTCLGDISDSYIRITTLEPPKIFKAGLAALEDALKDFKK